MSATAYPFPLVLKKKSQPGSSGTSGPNTPGGVNGGGDAAAKILLSEGDLAKADAALRGRK